MKVTIKRGKETTTFGNLSAGVVFEHNGAKFIKIFGYEYDKNEISLKRAYGALNLNSMEETHIPDETEIPVDSIFIPKEVIFK